MAHIGMVLIGDIRYDGRVRKEIGTLVNAGHYLELVVSDFNKNGSGGEDLGINIHYIPMRLWSIPALNFLEQLLFNYKAASILTQLPLTHIHCHDLSSLLAGVWVKEQLNAELVFDAHELMPESMGGCRERIWGYIEKCCVKSCDHIIMPEKNRIAYFTKKYHKIPKPLLLENFPCKKEIPTIIYNLFRDTLPVKKDQKIILYTGAISYGTYIEELIESMTMSCNIFVLVILGRAFKEYDETIRRKIKELSLAERVFLHGAVPHADILKYMASCDIGMALYRNTDLNNYYCASNKLYEYIALSKTVITNNYPGLLERVENFRQGICLAEVTPKSLAEAYICINNSSCITPGARKYFWEDVADGLLQLYNQ